jgi:hypothetical protein
MVTGWNRIVALLEKLSRTGLVKDVLACAWPW